MKYYSIVSSWLESYLRKEPNLFANIYLDLSSSYEGVRLICKL